MIGTIIGDIVGSPYEGDRLVQDTPHFNPLFLGGLSKFTDDTNLTIAVADAILNNLSFENAFIKWYKKYPNLGYGSSFNEWAEKGGGYTNESRGNGAAMRVSSIPLLAQTLPDISNFSFIEKMKWVTDITLKSTEPSHNCEEAKTGALAVTMACMLASSRDANNKPYTKNELRILLTNSTGYELCNESLTVEVIRNEWSKRDIRCNITVPQALICFLESTSFEDCLRLAVYSKGDVDTIAAIAGGIAEWYYGVDSINPEILMETKIRLPNDMIEVINQAYGNKLNW